MNVLVTDAENKNALAAIRSLGRRGVLVHAGSPRKLARGFVSVHCAESVRYPDPSDEEAFVRFVLELAKSRDLDVVLPIGDATNRVLSKHLPRLSESVAVPIAGWPAMRIASSKLLTMPFAEEAGVPIPRTYDHPDEVQDFPVVVKRSSGAGGVRYVHSRSELTDAHISDAVIQEWIPGEGYGFFALFDRGRERMIFMHKRVREYPVTGGASTVAESIYDPELAQLGLGLLRALDWHGVAMVEFKKDRRDGRYKLMEINPKFWGSLDLSIAAGSDFPYAAAQMAIGALESPLDGPPHYRTGVRFQWVFGDLVHVAARPRAARRFVRDLRDPRVEHDIDRQDLRPALFDLASTGAQIALRAARRNLRWPHGRLTPG